MPSDPKACTVHVEASGRWYRAELDAGALPAGARSWLAQNLETARSSTGAPGTAAPPTGAAPARPDPTGLTPQILTPEATATLLSSSALVQAGPFLLGEHVDVLLRFARSQAKWLVVSVSPEQV